MNKIYQAVGECRKTFVEMSYTYSQDINLIEEVVQECIMGFLQMNQNTLKKIYKKMGRKALLIMLQ